MFLITSYLLNLSVPVFHLNHFSLPLPDLEWSCKMHMKERCFSVNLLHYITTNSINLCYSEQTLPTLLSHSLWVSKSMGGTKPPSQRLTSRFARATQSSLSCIYSATFGRRVLNEKTPKLSQFYKNTHSYYLEGNK